MEGTRPARTKECTDSTGKVTERQSCITTAFDIQLSRLRSIDVRVRLVADRIQSCIRQGLSQSSSAKKVKLDTRKKSGLFQPRTLLFDHYPLVNKAKINDFHFHDLRHTFATRLAQSGVDVITIAALLGHSSILMTQRYTHPSDSYKVTAVEKPANF